MRGRVLGKCVGKCSRKRRELVGGHRGWDTTHGLLQEGATQLPGCCAVVAGMWAVKAVTNFQLPQRAQAHLSAAPSCLGRVPG